jgi:hypothetical protein
MTIGKTFKPYAATHGANPIKGIVSALITENADTVSQRADGATTVTRHYTEGHSLTVTIVAEVNESLAAIKIGDAAALTLSYFQQLEGANTAALAAARTIVCPKTGDAAKAVCTGKSDSAPNRGQPTLTLTFSVAAASGLPGDLYSVTDV